ncbi:hypothetical protein C8Q80DRAFT_1201486 [Daedaleopsis nitida]|nr:hypothetical protein C8Q80DRAFT_1201486 [Daedaleopsis nitida]
MASFMLAARHLDTMQAPTVIDNLIFPVEILRLVFEQVNDSRNLAKLVLFHRASVQPMVEDMLYRRITLTRGCPIVCLSETLRAQPHLGLHVHAFHVHLARDRDASPSLTDDNKIILSSLYTILRSLSNIVDLTLSVEALWDPAPPWDLSPSTGILTLRFPRLRTFICRHPGYIPSGASLLGTAVARFVGAHGSTLETLDMPLVYIPREEMEHLCPPVLVPPPQTTVLDVNVPAGRLLALRVLSCHWVFLDQLLHDQVQPCILDHLTHLRITDVTSSQLNRIARLSSASLVSLRIGGPLRARDAQTLFDDFVNNRPGGRAGSARFPHLRYIQVDAPSASIDGEPSFVQYTQALRRSRDKAARKRTRTRTRTTCTTVSR